MSSLSLGGVTIPDDAVLDWEQSTEILDGATLLEFSDGSAQMQAGPWSGSKRRLTIRASGWCPPGIAALARTSSHTLVWPALTATGTYTSQTMTVWIVERGAVREQPSDTAGGTYEWSLVLREA